MGGGYPNMKHTLYGTRFSMLVLFCKQRRTFFLLRWAPRQVQHRHAHSWPVGVTEIILKNRTLCLYHIINIPTYRSTAFLLKVGSSRKNALHCKKASKGRRTPWIAWLATLYPRRCGVIIISAPHCDDGIASKLDNTVVFGKKRVLRTPIKSFSDH